LNQQTGRTDFSKSLAGGFQWNIWDRMSTIPEKPDMTQIRKLADVAQRSSLKACEGWLRHVPWQLFCTFTFAWQVSDPQALKVFGEFVNRLERFVRGPIVLVRGDEKRYSGCGMPGAPRHFHALMAAHRRLDRSWVADHWMSLAGRRKSGAGADVRIYDPNLDGVAYVLKFINEPFGDWDLRNVDLFLSPLDHQPLSSRQRRRRARHEKRSEMAHTAAVQTLQPK
jgi:hypothetical protein